MGKAKKVRNLNKDLFDSRVWEVIRNGNTLDWLNITPFLKENSTRLTMPQIYSALRRKRIPNSTRSWLQSLKEKNEAVERLNFQLGLKPGREEFLRRVGSKKQQRKWNYKEKYVCQKLTKEEKVEKELEIRAKRKKAPKTFLVDSKVVREEELKEKRPHTIILEEPKSRRRISELVYSSPIERTTKKPKSRKLRVKRDKISREIRGNFSSLGVKLY